MDTSQRSLQLVAELEATLDHVKTRVTSNDLSLDQMGLLESRLASLHPWTVDVMHLTGPAGHNPQPAFEKCPTCTHYRLR